MDRIVNLDFKKDFPSEYMDKTDDVEEGKMVTLTVDKYAIKTDFNPRTNKQEDNKVVYFKEKPKKAVKLNKTMAGELNELFGSDSSKSIGKQVKLYWEWKGTQKRFHFLTNKKVKTNVPGEMDMEDIQI